MEDTKKCSKCGRELPLDQFYKRSNGVGCRSSCKECYCLGTAEWQKNNLDRVKAASVEWYKRNNEKVRKRNAMWRKNNPEKFKEGVVRWHRNNPRYWGDYSRRRAANDLEYRLMNNIRRAMNSTLRGRMKAGHTRELFGCSVEELRGYIQRQFQPGMTWDNYGRSGWHIDHIIPLDYFDFSDPEQQKRAWHYTNLQPLWAVDNLRKSNKIEERQLVLL